MTTGWCRTPRTPLTDTFLFGPVPDIAVAERQQYLTIALRDYLNEGGKLVQAGENTQYFGLLGRSLGGIFYGLAGAPDQDCVITRDFLSDCLLLSDDFAQYYLGATHRAPFVRPTGIDGRGPLDGVTAELGGPAVADNPLDEAGAFSLTSDELPAEDFPLFAGEATSTYRGAATVNPFGPVEGSRYAGALQGAGVVPADRPHGRPHRRAGHGGADPADEAVVQHAADVPPRDRGGGTVGHRRVDDAARSQRAHVVGPTHHLRRRLPPVAPPVPAATTCRRAAPAGRPAPRGSWNAFTGESGGWVDAAFDLSPYAGQQVDVKVSYVTDAVDVGVGGGIGVFVDDTRLTVGGTVVERRRVRGGRRCLGRRGPSRRQPTGRPRQLRRLDRADLRRLLGRHGGHGTARLRHRVPRHPRRTGGRARPRREAPAPALRGSGFAADRDSR